MTEKDKKIIENILHCEIIKDPNDLRFKDYSTFTYEKPTTTKPNIIEDKGKN